LDQEKTYKWIQDRLRDLHSGNLSETDRLRLEQLATTDPFIQDALDGYKSHADQDHSSVLKVLEQRIQNKSATRRPKLVPLSRGFILQAVAASLVLILATWAVIYYVEKGDENGMVSDAVMIDSASEHTTEVQLTYPDSAGQADGAISSTEVLRHDTEAGSREQGVKGKSLINDQSSSREEDVVTSEAKKYSANEPVSPPPVVAQSKSTDDLKEKDVVTESVVAEELSVKQHASDQDLKRDEGYFANQMSSSDMASRVTGQVINKYGESVTGAIIQVPKTNLVTTTNEYGRFELKVPNPSATLDVIAGGYADTSLTVLPGQEDVVIMVNEDKTILPASKTGAVKTMSESRMAPGYAINSMVSFSVYLKNNSRLPISHDISAHGKEVTLRFEINAKGRPDKIEMIRSNADKMYRDEAIRLIKDGPDWVCESGKYPCEQEYTIFFQ
jgi:hypothetical protein